MCLITNAQHAVVVWAKCDGGVGPTKATENSLIDTQQHGEMVVLGKCNRIAIQSSLCE